MRKERPHSPSKKGKRTRHIRGFFYAICIALVIRIFVIEPYRIPSESMYPSILKGDMLMANKFIYGVFIPIVNWKIPGFVDPKPGSIVLFQSPSYESPGKWKEILNFFTFGIFGLDNNNANPRYFIKRTIGVSGDALTLVDPRRNNFAFQVIRNGDEEVLKTAPRSGDWKNVDDLDFFEESNTPAIIQYQKFRDSFFQTRENDVVDSLYVPRKGDELKFILISDTGVSKEMLKGAKRDGLSLDLSYDAKIKLSVRRVEGKTKRIQFDGVISGRTFDVFYYSQRPNSLLSSEDIYNLYENGHVEIPVKDNFYFMLGDNRDNSEDSRYWGFVPSRYIIGSPMIRYWPASRLGSVNLKKIDG